MLSSKLIPDIADRAKYLLQRYQKKYARLLSAPDWENEEIAELGPNLRQSVSTEMKNKAEILARLKHLAFRIRERS